MITYLDAFHAKCMSMFTYQRKKYESSYTEFPPSSISQCNTKSSMLMPSQFNACEQNSTPTSIHTSASFYNNIIIKIVYIPIICYDGLSLPILEFTDQSDNPNFASSAAISFSFSIFWSCVFSRVSPLA